MRSMVNSTRVLLEDGKRSTPHSGGARAARGSYLQGANHGFHNDTTPRYDEAAAKEAWRHTLDWFNKYLKA